MTSVLESEQYRHLRKFIDDHGKVYDYPFQIEGVPNPVQAVYRVPLGLLRLNIQNGRYAAERMARERQLGIRFDRLNPEHQRIIRQLLKEENPSRWHDLKVDLREHGQQTPAIVTAEGDVINGNRRMALLLELFDETHNAKFEVMDCTVLPLTVSEKALWRIEAGIQLSQPAQLEYGPINNLLKLREGIVAGLSFADMAAVLLGSSQDDIVESLDRLNLIDRYLDYHSKTGEYVAAQKQGLHEYFVNLQKVIKAWQREGVDKVVISRRIENAFNVMQIVGYPGIKFSQTEFRRIRDIYSDDEARQRLETGIHEAVADDSAVKESTIRGIKNAWDDANEVEKINKDKDQSFKHVKIALDHLKAVDPKSNSFHDGRVARRLLDIETLVTVLLKNQNTM